MDQYRKEAHERFVSGHEGSSIIDIILTVLPIVPGIILASSFDHIYSTGTKWNYWNFIQQFILCALPMILSFTVFSSAIIELNAILLFLMFLRITWLNSAKWNSSKNILKEKLTNGHKLTFLTTSRATVNLATIIAILAVDFHVFPRRYAKTEEYGYSLMDVGAPCYVFMNAITDSKSKSIPNHTAQNSLILFFLGMIRLVSVSLTHYQHHVTEYGLHANFFFILSFIKIACSWVPLVPTQLKLLGSLLIAAVHQSNLNAGLAAWTLSAEPRNSFVTANREFIVSMPGYVQLYLLGSVLGDLLFHSKVKLRSLGVSCLVPFVAVFVLETQLGFKASRRLANPTFVAWIAGFFTLFLNLFYLCEKLVSFQLKLSDDEASVQPPMVMQAINSSPLMFFLLGNVFTGLVNFSINTLETSSSAAFFIITNYVFVLVLIVFIIQTRKKKRSNC